MCSKSRVKKRRSDWWWQRWWWQCGSDMCRVVRRWKTRMWMKTRMFNIYGVVTAWWASDVWERNMATIPNMSAVNHKTKHSGLPAYLSNDLHDYQPARTLPSDLCSILTSATTMFCFLHGSFLYRRCSWHLESTLCTNSIYWQLSNFQT